MNNSVYKSGEFKGYRKSDVKDFNADEIDLGGFFKEPVAGQSTMFDWNGDGTSGYSEVTGTTNSFLSSPEKGGSTVFDWDGNGNSGFKDLFGEELAVDDAIGLGKLGFGIWAGLGANKAAKDNNKLLKEKFAFDKKSSINAFDSTVKQYNNQAAGMNSLRNAVIDNRKAAGDSVGSVNYTKYLNKWNGGNEQTVKNKYEIAGLKK